MRPYILSAVRRTRTMVLAVSLTAMVGYACASGGSPDATRRSPNLISAEELTEVATLNAWEAVGRLRPRWLQTRGASSLRGEPSLPVVYVDNANFGNLDSLRLLSVQDIDFMRYRNASDATTRYGTGHTGGVIEVFTKGR